jgi:uncharacterized lipoprotein
MQKTLTLAAVAAIALAACNGEPEKLSKDDPMADALKNAQPVQPPPMIQASRTYRCRDNSLVYIDFFTNNTAVIRTEQGGEPTAMVTAEGGNPPYTGSGYSVSANAEQISYTSPSGTQSCRA